MASDILLRPGSAGDIDFLTWMLYVAYHWNPELDDPTYDEFRCNSEAVTRFIDGWGRPGDHAVIAEVEALQVGAAWYRQLRADNHGHSFVDESIPCVAIAVVAEYRGHGIGGRLLEALLSQARNDGFSSVSLAVEADNPALRLYLRHGFQHDAEVDGYYRMLTDLSRPSTERAQT